jgi:Ser-tRNA(Ala) deacylase AlaX
MTELLYFSSDALTAMAMVQTCQEARECYVVTLDHTIFHPQGGGQPCDIGRMGDAVVTKVTTKSGEVLHTVNQPVPLGPVILQVNAPLRFLHARLHSAGHLIGNAVGALGLVATRAHHWPGESRVLVSHPDAEHALTTETVQALVDSFIEQNLPRVVHVRNGHRDVGFGDLQAFPCGGTHVESTAVVGRCIVGAMSDSTDGIWIRYSVD